MKLMIPFPLILMGILAVTQSQAASGKASVINKTAQLPESSLRVSLWGYEGFKVLEEAATIGGLEGFVCNRIKKALRGAYIINVDRYGVDIYLDGAERRFTHAEARRKLAQLERHLNGCDANTVRKAQALIDEYYDRAP